MRPRRHFRGQSRRHPALVPIEPTAASVHPAGVCNAELTDLSFKKVLILLSYQHYQQFFALPYWGKKATYRLNLGEEKDEF